MNKIITKARVQKLVTSGQGRVVGRVYHDNKTYLVVEDLHYQVVYHSLVGEGDLRSS